ncbi:MAG: glycosyltransferase family 4 protein [Thiohalocapsa sp.]
MRQALIVAHWLTDFGGLHENVLDTAAGLVAGGWQVTVVAPAALVMPRFIAAGIRFVPHPLEDPAAGAAAALAHGPFDIVHAHPFQARRVGMAVAAALGVPLVVTLHGQYDDEFEQYGVLVRRIVCVSQAVADYVDARAPILADRLAVIPNGVDFDVFAPLDAPLSGRRKTIAVCSRLDPDKGVLAQAVADLAKGLAAAPRDPMVLLVAGDRLYGPAENPFTAAIDSAAANAGIELVRCGWLADREALRRFYGAADVVVAPGRAAMEAIACAVPTIAAASRGYIGLVTRDSLALAQATNFGGVQLPATHYRPGSILDDVRRAFAMPNTETRVLRGRLRDIHDIGSIQSAHVALYDSLCRS